MCLLKRNPCRLFRNHQVNSIPSVSKSILPLSASSYVELWEDGKGWPLEAEFSLPESLNMITFKS